MVIALRCYSYCTQRWRTGCLHVIMGLPNLSLLPIPGRDSARGRLPITVVAPATHTNALCQDENVNEQQEC
eukprot:COSAG02_NODE_1756_length_11052_cov_5.309230_8_plen_71_part_00